MTYATVQILLAISAFLLNGIVWILGFTASTLILRALRQKDRSKYRIAVAYLTVCGLMGIWMIWLTFNTIPVMGQHQPLPYVATLFLLISASMAGWAVANSTQKKYESSSNQ